MRKVGLLLSRTSRTLTAVQDHFGKAYRCFSYHPQLGKVFENKFVKVNTEHEAQHDMACIPLRHVHANTVRSLVRKSNHPDTQMPKGYWYEVSGE